jgi:ABC-type cobalamin/Fe3+-siderophores transport system ATPase subunit
MSTPVFSIENFSYSTGDKELLHDLTLDIHHNEYLIIVGPNGAGKSTLLKCLNRLNTGWQGHLELLGKPLASYKQKELAQKVGYVPQHMSAAITLSVSEFVGMSRYPYLGVFGSPGPEHEAIIKQALVTSKLDILADRALHTLSGGERQRVLIAAALAQDTDILLMDEPTTFLDPGQQEGVYHLLSTLRETHTNLTMICVTHDVNYAAQNADRILALNEGQKTFLGAPAEFMQQAVLEELYNTPFNILNHPTTGAPIALPGSVQ